MSRVGKRPLLSFILLPLHSTFLVFCSILSFLSSGIPPSWGSQSTWRKVRGPSTMSVNGPPRLPPRTYPLGQDARNHLSLHQLARLVQMVEHHGAGVDPHAVVNRCQKL